MGIENLQGTPWHEEQVHRSCKEGSKYCIYNQHDLCRCKVSEHYRQTCVGKGLCEWFESKGGTPKTVGKDIYIKIIPQNSRQKDMKLPAISIKKKVITGEETMENYDDRQEIDEFNTNEEETENQNETRNEKFLRIAEVRVNKLVDMIHKIDNLSNKNNYEFTEEQAQQIFDFIQNELDEVKGHFFKSGKVERKFKFK